MLKTYEFSSVLAPHIETFISLKRSSGFSFDLESYYLNLFDKYCVEHSLSEPSYSKEFLGEWMTLKETESNETLSRRISVVRQLSLYLNGIGIPAYVPHKFSSSNGSVPYALVGKELHAFFEVLDNAVAELGPLGIPHPNRARLKIEYKIMFRLYYCCGLRNNELCSLKSENVDLDNGIIRIIRSKGNLDRLVYMADDVLDLVRKYWEWLISILGKTPVYFFPALDCSKGLHKSTIEQVFNNAWKKTDFYNKTVKKPVVHSLRHGFTVDRINHWTAEGIDIERMIPYLSTYLGHSNHEETHYYYHLTSASNRVIRNIMADADSVIPEVSHEK